MLRPTGECLTGKRQKKKWKGSKRQGRQAGQMCPMGLRVLLVRWTRIRAFSGTFPRPVLRPVPSVCVLLLACLTWQLCCRYDGVGRLEVQDGLQRMAKDAHRAQDSALGPLRRLPAAQTAYGSTDTVGPLSLPRPGQRVGDSFPEWMVRYIAQTTGVRHCLSEL